MTNFSVGGVDSLFGGMMTGEQIYQSFRSGQGSGWLREASDEFNGAMKEYEDFRTEAENLMKDMGSAWEGKAGSGAQRAAGPIAVELASAHTSMDTSQDLFGRQGELFDHIRSKVVPVPPKPPAPSPKDIVFNAISNFATGEDTDAAKDYEAAMRDHSDAAKHNIEQMRQYSDGSDYNTTNLPTYYGQMLASESDIRVDDGGGDSTGGDTSGGTTSGWNHSGYAYNPGGDPGVTTPAGNGGYDSTGGGPGVTAPPGTGGQPGPTNTNTAGVGPAAAGPSTGLPVGQQGGPGSGLGPNGGGPVSRGYGPGGMPVGGYGGSGFGSGGYGSGSGSGRGGWGGGGSSSGSGEPESGSRSGLGRKAPGGSAAAEEAAASKASPRSSTGRPMAPRGGSGKGDEDTEHERPSWLVMSDPDDFWFGGLPPVAPPNIE